MITPESALRLRPSVAMVPMEGGQWQFFLGNTRRSRVFRLKSELATAITKLNGDVSLASAAFLSGADISHLIELAKVLHEGCLLEHGEVAQRVTRSPFRRVLNFLGDYLPSDELEDAFCAMRGKTVVILGIGAVGSWIATELSHSGFERFILIDDDLVESSNLNRSLYSQLDVGKRKVDALADRMLSVNTKMEIQGIEARLTDANELTAILETLTDAGIVVNCADNPSVDVTSALIDGACQVTNTPYVIAGGYNLHLSLIGMTVLPKITACYYCSRITLEQAQGDELVGMKKLARPWRNIGNLAPLAAITASFAANEVIRVAISDSRLPPAMVNRRGEFNFLTGEMHFVNLPPRVECGCVQNQ